MMNNNILQNYQKEVLELFKCHYRLMSAKDLQLEFQNVLDSTLDELGISKQSAIDVSYFREWYNLVHHHLFIKEIIKNRIFNEVIFHSNTKAQVVSNELKETVEINNLSLEDYQLSFEIFAMKNNISWNFSEPFASFSTKLEDNEYRVTLIHSSTSANKKSKIFLRLIKKQNPRLSNFSDDSSTLHFLTSLIKDKKNILISGSTGSGKTTFLRALLSEVPKNEHVVILEDAHEILTFSENQTSFLAQEGQVKKSLKDYCAFALRMSPDRLILGEMRSIEVVPFMLAMNTGHRGLMSTVHANSSIDALARIALLFSLYSGNKEIDFSLITKLTCKNIDYVIHMENKSIKEICRVIGSEAETPFYEIIYEKNLLKTS